MGIIYEKDKLILVNDNDIEVGELCYRYIDECIVLIGTYIDSDYRGNGYFKYLLKTLMEMDNKGCTIYICCIEPFIYPTIQKMGFQKIDEPIPIWGMVSNGVNFKFIP